jgi:hypothetical protein
MLLKFVGRIKRSNLFYREIKITLTLLNAFNIDIDQFKVALLFKNHFNYTSLILKLIYF